MRHMVDGRKFGTNTSHRKAIFKSLANNLILHEQVTTTIAKAKELRRVVDRLITLGKEGSLHAKRMAFDRTRDRDSVVKLFSALADRYASRKGGYTRVLRLDGTRWGDGSELAVVELVDRPELEKKKPKVKKEKASDETSSVKAEGKSEAKKQAKAAKTEETAEKKKKSTATKGPSKSAKKEK